MSGQLRKRKSYQMFRNFAEFLQGNPSPADILQKVFELTEEMRAWGSETMSQYASESLNQVIKDFGLDKAQDTVLSEEVEITGDAWARGRNGKLTPKFITLSGGAYDDKVTARVFSKTIGGTAPIILALQPPDCISVAESLKKLAYGVLHARRISGNSGRNGEK